MSARSIRLAGTIERRLLINYRLGPDVARGLVPDPLRPQLIDGFAVAGVCLIRLGDLRPSVIVPRIGWRAENAAHRIAVEWGEGSDLRHCVYIPVRHSASWFPVALGGSILPGVHRHARFRSNENARRISVSMTSARAQVTADIETTDEWSSALWHRVSSMRSPRGRQPSTTFSLCVTSLCDGVRPTRQ